MVWCGVGRRHAGAGWRGVSVGSAALGAVAGAVGALVLAEWSAVFRVFHRAPRPILTELQLFRTLDLAAFLLGDPEPTMLSSAAILPCRVASGWMRWQCWPNASADCPRYNGSLWPMRRPP